MHGEKEQHEALGRRQFSTDSTASHGCGKSRKIGLEKKGEKRNLRNSRFETQEVKSGKNLEDGRTSRASQPVVERWQRCPALEREDTCNGYSTTALELDQPDALDQARELHTRFFPGAAAAGDVPEATALVNMYGRCGERERCQDRLDEMEHRKITLVTYSLNQQCLEALRFFRTMLLEGVRLDSFMCLKSLEKKLAKYQSRRRERKKKPMEDLHRLQCDEQHRELK
ncbi:hypothetical protein SELMODRAFT_411766 [Selaginella moellendorffii]|uniref:Pentacotripeptide-repeat region of PRORP domain-containing protein n=1 Tax=Selaginella moellendorffii TaxID=88036 RepID=D8RIZ3_SELML|nr:hypothetical protein SELMODRAFT_411766 [Selaginella moellendorffii]